MNYNGDGTVNMWQGMLAGAGAGFTQVVATQPMEIIKLRMQIAAKQGGDMAKMRCAYHGSHCCMTKDSRSFLFSLRLHSAVDHVKRLKLRGLYRYTSATLLRDVPFSLIFFPLYSHLKDTFTPEGELRIECYSNASAHRLLCCVQVVRRPSSACLRRVLWLVLLVRRRPLPWMW